MKARIALALGFLILHSAFCLSAHAQGTAFTYQGRLNSGANAANGSYDLTFALFATSSGGSAVAGPLTNSATGVTNGLFTVSLDFGGGVFTGNALWLELGVRTNGSGSFTTLAPRQPILPTPYALYASNSANALTASSAATAVNGVVTTGTYADPGWITSLAAGKIAGNISGNASGFSGNLAGDVTGPQGTTVISSGAVNNTKLASDAASLVKVSGGAMANFGGNVGIGKLNPATALDVNGTVPATSFSGNGAGLTNLNAAQLTGYSAATPPANGAPILNMVWIVPGTFVMGSPTNEQDRVASEGPQTMVTLTNGFWMGHHPVTQGEYQTVIGANPSYFTGDLSRPVEQVTWLNATNFCYTLTQREQSAGRLPAGWVYRLPTEGEWEYCCRALTTSRFYYGNDPSYSSLTNYAWYSANSPTTTQPVGQRLANPWGLVDMAGNVWEWCHGIRILSRGQALNPELCS